MKRHTIAWVGALGLLGATVVAQPRPARPGPRTGPHPGRLEEALGLDPGQVEQMHQLRVEQRKSAIRQKADIEVARMELQETLAADNVDERAVSAKVDALAKLQAAALRARVDNRLALRKILTAEQVRKLEQLRDRERGPRGMRERSLHRRPARGGPFAGGSTSGPEDEGHLGDEDVHEQ